MEKNNYCIYKHTFPNGKVYIGITSQKPEKRWVKGHGYSSQPGIRNAINKYGWENIKSEILFNNLSEECANKKEKELISFYRSKNRKHGYNLTEGGYGRSGFKLSQEAKEKISKANLGRQQINVNQYDLSGNFIKFWTTITEASKTLNISDGGICDVAKGKGSTAGGFMWRYSKDYPENKNIEPVVINKRKFREIDQLSLDGKLIKTWPTIREAAKNMPPLFSNNENAIINRLKRRFTTKEAFGFIWKYSDDNDFSLNIPPKRTKGKKVFQYDLQGNLIKEWINTGQASKALKINPASILRVCKGTQKTTGGFIWKHSGNTDFSKNIEPKKKTSKKISQYDLNGNLIKEWGSIQQASKELNINPSGISSACRGELKTSSRFIWKFVGDTDFSKNIEPNKTTAKKVFQYNLNGNFVKEWGSMVEASKALNVSESQISRVCRGKIKTAGGFILKYAKDSDKLQEKVV
jgi:hypothetical protein